MKPPTIAPAYVTLYPGLCEVARRNGYALALHGSLSTDMDCVAIPWTDAAVGQDFLFAAVKQYLSLLFPALRVQGATLKPQGRIAWAFDLGHGAQVDLSVMPLTDNVISAERARSE
jgi:hypothetical protein